MMLFLTTNAYAMSSCASPLTTTSPKCADVIEACDKAIAAQKEEKQAMEEALKLAQAANFAKTEQLKAKDAQLSSPVRQPVVLLGVGILGTVLGGPVITGAGALILHVLLQ